MCYSTVRVSKSILCCEHVPIADWAYWMSSLISSTGASSLSYSFIYTVPVVGYSLPISTFNDVVLPAPLCPKKQKISFLFKFKFKLSTAVKELKFFVMFANWTAGCVLEIRASSASLPWFGGARLLWVRPFVDVVIASSSCERSSSSLFLFPLGMLLSESSRN